MKRIGLKLFAAFLCMAAVAIGLLWLIQAGVMKGNYLAERVNAVDEAVLQAGGTSAGEYRAIEERLNIRLLLLGKDKAILYESQGMPMRGRLLRLCMDGAATKADGQAHELPMEMGGGRYAILGRELPGMGTMYAVFSLADVEEASRILLNQLWIVTAALFGASVLMALLLSRMFARPIRTITDTARALAAGRLDTRAAVRSKDEIGELAGALNELGVELAKTEELRRELIANVSHDLRAPLAVIRGYAETVRDVTWPDERKRAEQLTAISDEAARLSRIVSDILDFSRLQAGVDAPAPVDFELRPSLEAVTRRHEHTAAEAGISISLECPSIMLRFDPMKFERVLDNLLANAIGHAEADSAVSVQAEPAHGRCRISVMNTGDEIPPEELPRIWDRYYRTQSAGRGGRQGAGLGLAIVKSILERHGTLYGVTSRNRQTVFWFEAPIVPETRGGLAKEPHDA